MQLIGTVEVYAMPVPGRRRPTLLFRKKNRIVDIGLSATSRLLGGGAGTPTVDGDGFTELSDLTIGTMLLGNHPSPSEPADDDTVGVQQLLYTPPITVTYPDAVSVRFTGIIPQTDANGNTITEEALLLRNGKLFSRVLLNVPKTSLAPLGIIHTITALRG